MYGSKYLVGLGVALAAATFAVSCTSGALSPTVPSNSSTSSTALSTNADGTTLKVSAPVPAAPGDGTQLDTGVVATTLTANTSAGQFASASGLTYRFQVLQGSTIIDEKLAATNAATVSVTTKPLAASTTYTWRVRPESSDGSVGSWSSSRSFTTGQVLQPQSDGEWAQVILLAAKGVNPEATDPVYCCTPGVGAMLAVERNLRSMGFFAAVIPDSSGGPSDHKIWINGTAWAIVCSDNFKHGTFSFCPYVQVGADSRGFNSCGIPNSAKTGCPPW